MSSVRRVQTERLLQDVVHSLYSEGHRPVFAEITRRIARYFSRYPAGSPLPMPIQDVLAQGTSNTDAYNTLLQHLAVNLDTLYEVALRQVEDATDLVTALQTHLDRLNKKRRRIETKIDDYLLSTRNTDGYFFSVSDNFTDLSFVDLSLTTAEVDTTVGAIFLPTIASLTTRVPSRLISDPTIEVSVFGEQPPPPVVELAPFSGAIEDSLDNLIWAFEVATRQPVEVVAQVDLFLGEDDPVSLSRIDFTPYGGSPVQVFFQTREHGEDDWEDFGGRIQTGTTKMIFGTSPKNVSELRMILRKTSYDYTESINGQIVYKYIFGAKDIAFFHQVYEANARFVSQPLSIPSDFDEDFVIDAISIAVDADTPSGTNLRFMVAPTDGSHIQDIADLSWTEISPIDTLVPEHDRVIRFDGAVKVTRDIREEPGNNDLQLILPEESGPIADRNPSPAIIEGVDVYRIAAIDDEPLKNSLKLFEGINSTRIYSRNIDHETPFSAINLGYWGHIFDAEQDSLTVDFGAIDAGNEFFYGGDVGSIGKDVYVETFLDADKSFETFLAEFQKVDIRAQTWDVKVFLNGRPLGALPLGANRAHLPWNLRQGLNHVVLLIRIPLESDVMNHSAGTLSLFGDGLPLYEYGLVRLAKWRYVDLFTMRYNESGQPLTFTIHNNEIISRRKPTRTNFQVQYASKTDRGPSAVRLRADLSRSRNVANVSPQLNSYRLRFSYGE